MNLFKQDLVFLECRKTKQKLAQRKRSFLVQENNVLFAPKGEIKRGGIL